MRSLSGNSLAGFIGFALLLCAQSASAQTRPVLSEVFQSAATIEITTGTGADAETVEGAGEVAFNQPAGLAREFYAFDDGPPIEIITRYDLGKIFTINPPSCDVEDVTGPMPLFWDWVAQAKQGDNVVVNGIEGTEWVSTGSAPKPTQILAATKPGTLPLYYEVRTTDPLITPQTVRITFLNWTPTFTQKASSLKPPRKCPK